MAPRLRGWLVAQWARVDRRKYMDLQRAESKWTHMHHDYHEIVKDTLAAFYALLPDRGTRILDAGCGDGWTMNQMRSDGYGALIGVDLNADKIRHAVANGLDARMGVLGQLMLLPAESFDAVYCRHTLEHVADVQGALREFLDLLTPGGLLFLVVPRTGRRGSHVQRFRSLNEVSGLLVRAGYTVQDAQEHDKAEHEFWVVGRRPARRTEE